MEWITEFITQYGLIAMFLLIALEYACLPLPSEVVLPLSGALAVTSGKPLMLVIVISVVAGLLGSMICYSIGYSGGNLVLDKLMHRYPSTKKELNQHVASINNMPVFQLESVALNRYTYRNLYFIYCWNYETNIKFIFIGFHAWNFSVEHSINYTWLLVSGSLAVSHRIL